MASLWSSWFLPSALARASGETWPEWLRSSATLNLPCPTIGRLRDPPRYSCLSVVADCSRSTLAGGSVSHSQGTGERLCSDCGNHSVGVELAGHFRPH